MDLREQCRIVEPATTGVGLVPQGLLLTVATEQREKTRTTKSEALRPRTHRRLRSSSS
jgi:hypothetical protein